MDSSDFYTLDVADFMGKPAEKADVETFVTKHKGLVGSLSIDGIDSPVAITEDQIRSVATKSLLAVKEAGTLYRHIEKAKGADNFVTEVSMDETDQPQTPVEMLFILAAIADEGIPAQTVAPKFCGRFNKGIDYVGEVSAFTKEFQEDLAVLAYAKKEFGLPESLKLSIHTGSDKFSIYGAMAESIKKFDSGLHIKTAGTTWLEELIGLAMAGGDGLTIAKEVYATSLDKYDEMCGPYANVIDIDKSKLPTADEVNGWDGDTYASSLRHDPSCDKYNLHFRQLLHVAYKVAAKMGDRYLDALKKHEEVIAKNVTENIYDRHVKPLFVDGK